MEKQEHRYFKGLTRKKYIEKACEILKQRDEEDISIRELARELGCSSAALYRYFDGKSELLYFTAMTTLEEYIERLNEAEKRWKNVWETYVGVWDCYCKEAFRHPKEFNRLFFENTNSTLNDSIQEYYQMFPENIGQSNEYFHKMLNTPDFWGRDYEMCRKCAETGAIRWEDVKRLNRLACMMYKGYFKGVYDDGIEEAKVDDYVRLFIEDLDMIVKAIAIDLKGYKGYYLESGGVQFVDTIEVKKKEERHMLGQPKFQREDQVRFKIQTTDETRTYDGVIYVVDANGTSEQTEEPSYDIEAFVDGEVRLFKHIRESLVAGRE